MDCSTITAEEFVDSARKFVSISDKIGDQWKLYDSEEIHSCHLKKNLYIEVASTPETAGCSECLRAEYVMFYNLSYGVPAFSFNIWHSSGVLLSLEEIRNLGFVKISKEEFYSVITQQEHPLFHRPYFIMHPCHTPELLTNFKDRSKNIIVTFLSLITPLIKLELDYQYGVDCCAVSIK